MQVEELRAGLHSLGILHESTLPSSPYQKAKQETFWVTPEGRLMVVLDGRSAGRDCPDSEALRRTFRCSMSGRQRRSDGAVSLAGKHFVVPTRYRHLEQPQLRRPTRRPENALAREDGFDLIIGDPGTGKSVALHLLFERLGQLRDLPVGAIAQPGRLRLRRGKNRKSVAYRGIQDQ